MANGFPEGDFRIINEGTGEHLLVQYGGMTEGKAIGVDRLTGEKGIINYAHTDNPLFKLGTPSDGDYDLWWFSTIADQWNRPNNYLMTDYRDIRSRFALNMSEGSKSVVRDRELVELESHCHTLGSQLIDPAHSRGWNDPEEFFEKLLSFIEDKQHYETLKYVWHEQTSGQFLGSSHRFEHDHLIRQITRKLEDESLVAEVDKAYAKARQAYQEALQRYNTMTSEQREALTIECEAAREQWQAKFNAAPRTASVELYMIGSGCQGVSKWETDDGYLYREGYPDFVLTVRKSHDRVRLSFEARGSADNQKWKFKKK